METEICLVSFLEKGARPVDSDGEASEYTVLSVIEYDGEILVGFIHDDGETGFLETYSPLDTLTLCA